MINTIETIDEMIEYYKIVQKTVYDHYFTHKSRDFLIETLQERKGEGWITDCL